MIDDDEYYLSQIPKQQKTRLAASKVSAVLNRVIQQRGYAAVQSTQLLREAWEKAVGTELAKHCEVGAIERGVLQVFVGNSVVKNELEFLRSSVLKYLETNLADFKIRSIRIRLRS